MYALILVFHCLSFIVSLYCSSSECCSSYSYIHSSVYLSKLGIYIYRQKTTCIKMHPRIAFLLFLIDIDCILGGVVSTVQREKLRKIYSTISMYRKLQ
ncbi:hypothetical protein C8R41DRAFT_203480 [Lentinula lateritia]|uniref:Secreted protein n=1 Tax=Lentinula lateritia TaxID=40482 RepID=A0ABQ8W0D6_9AGAR|nr:hypothetical protein C8R41DRAFT_203480 [Lentinula lateritia]